ncbi:MAG: pyridoxamine 5'-phosphate oxidase family protein [Actinomycetia bacterium]|nr:pyridoxamine 5'-phosphate oxidase family protein [Actinomycetes bacterium]MCH9701966.1 pyridoxamine 5'-phosphate oxidase family protein [Actinomycetes bacterium]MCH9760857.1 pyridoxamine 5'-phosphate oxidase family protein [Actinomycetes bacterium]
MDAASAPETPVTELTEEDCWNLLSGVSLGRLVTTVDGWTEIFPVNFVVQQRTVLFRTAEGTKLLTAVLNENVVFEADDHNVAEGWSVVLRGTARALSTSGDVEEAQRAGLYPWVATRKLRFVRITPDTLTGRRFVFGPEPD